MDLLRFVTAGDVDNGKSTLIGRLLYDTKSILEDQLLAVEEASRRRGFDGLNLALLTDGLRAEREQGITIDVAYRYFSTPRRKFIIADCPGHVQYTRNMVTGASNAHLAIALVDAQAGIQEQTRRHCFVASLLQIPHLVLCVNKMDLVGYSEAAFEKIREQFVEFSKKLDIHDVTFIPMSALEGENVVRRSDKMPWYTGRSVLEHLEEVHIASDVNHVDFRFPVQLVIRPPQNASYRGYAGTVTSGEIRKGEEVVALPSGFASRVAAIEAHGGELGSAGPQASVVLRLTDEIDLGRGDMLVRPNNRPTSSQDVQALICWMSRDALNPKKRYLVRHTTCEAVAMIKTIQYKVDVNTLHRDGEDKVVGLNDFARVSLHAAKALHHDPYRLNRGTGSFILVDEGSGATVAAGMILRA